MAVEVSTKQMALTRDLAPGGFMERSQAMLVLTAGNVLHEPAATPHHSGRAVYAQRVVGDPYSAHLQAATQVVMGVNVVNTTTYDEVTKTSTCTIADIDLQSQVMTLWDGLAGLDTPS
jgi:hypothetical protein